MAVSFKNNFAMLLQEHAEHINEKHVDVAKEHGASKFLCVFNLTSTMAFLVWKPFRDSEDYKSYFYIYVFKMKKLIAVCPWGYPTDEIYIYPSPGTRLTPTNSRSLSAYYFLLKQRNRMMAL